MKFTVLCLLGVDRTFKTATKVIFLKKLCWAKISAKYISLFVNNRSNKQNLPKILGPLHLYRRFISRISIALGPAR